MRARTYADEGGDILRAIEKGKLGDRVLGVEEIMGDRAGASMLALQLSCRGNALRERILRDLVSFAESRGELQLLQTLPKTPKGAQIDWLRLYEEVVAKGGYQFVSQQRLWPEIAAKECMNIDIMPYVLALYYER